MLRLMKQGLSPDEVAKQFEKASKARSEKRIKRARNPQTGEIIEVRI